MVTISRDEWLAALGEADTPSDPDAVTTAEFATMLGCARCTAQNKLVRLVREGKAVRTMKLVDRGPLAGSTRVPAYKLVKAKARG